MKIRRIVLFPLIAACVIGSAAAVQKQSKNQSETMLLSSGADQTERLRFTNQCNYDVWIQNSGNVPGMNKLTKLAPGARIDVHISNASLSATRFWPKSGCDATGNNCQIGQSNPNTDGSCPAGGCRPPTDSKLEVTWNSNGTWLNTSVVDGYTIPYTLKVYKGSDETDSTCSGVDASQLTLDKCPTGEDLSSGGKNIAYFNQDLRVFSPDKKVIGCFSPNQKMTYPGFGGIGIGNAQDPRVTAYSCEGFYHNSEKCRKGPVKDTKYVKMIHQYSPNNYSYAYDDAIGLHRCSSLQSKLEFITCPSQQTVCPEPTNRGSHYDIENESVYLQWSAPVSSTNVTHYKVYNGEGSVVIFDNIDKNLTERIDTTLGEPVLLSNGKWGYIYNLVSVCGNKESDKVKIEVEKTTEPVPVEGVNLKRIVFGNGGRQFVVTDKDSDYKMTFYPEKYEDNLQKKVTLPLTITSDNKTCKFISFEPRVTESFTGSLRDQKTDAHCFNLVVDKTGTGTETAYTLIGPAALP